MTTRTDIIVIEHMTILRCVTKQPQFTNQAIMTVKTSTKTGTSTFCRLLLTILLTLLWGCGQPQAPPQSHVGILMFGSARQDLVDGFKNGLAEQGFVEGDNIRFTILSAKKDKSVLPDLIQQLADQNLDLLAVAGGVEADAAQKVLSTTDGPPVVVLCTSNLLKRKLVQCRQQPGWNVTGIDSLNLELTGKRLELLKEMLPEAKTIMVMFSAKANSPSRKGMQLASHAAVGLGLEIKAHEVASGKEVKETLAKLEPGQIDAMLMLPAAEVINSFTDTILPESKRLQMPIFSYLRFMTEAGGLASYGPDYPNIGRQAARLAEKILHGTPASKIPFEATQHYDYTVNRETMAQLGIPISDQLRSKVHDFVPLNQLPKKSE